MWLLRRFLLILFITPFGADAAEPQSLSANSFAESGDHRGVVLLGINWNRMWDCGGYENAQLHEISFTLLNPGDSAAAISTLDFRIPGRLFKSDYFTEYEILLAPGEYALSSFDIKIAESASRVRVDSPIPWRYYIDSRERFETFVAGLWSKYPFLADTPAQFRLFSTTRFGLPFSLDETPDD